MSSSFSPTARAEYVRAVFGMLLHEADARLELLPGIPPAWASGEGLLLSDVPTAFGTLSLSARQSGTTLRVVLQAGLRPDTTLALSCPARQRPVAVTVDGVPRSDFDAEGLELARPFHELIATW